MVRLIYERLIEIHDDEAKVKRVMQTKMITLYDESDYFVPTMEEEINLPCLMVEELDEKLSTKEHKIMTPIEIIPIDEKLAEFFKRHIPEEDLEIYNG